MVFKNNFFLGGGCWAWSLANLKVIRSLSLCKFDREGWSLLNILIHLLVTCRYIYCPYVVTTTFEQMFLIWENHPPFVTFHFFHNNNALKNAHKTLDFMNFHTFYIPKALHLNHKIVVAYELEPPHNRRETKNPSPTLSSLLCQNLFLISISHILKVFYS